MHNVLITGANRGIGLEFVRQFVANGDRVFATARDLNAATDLGHLAMANPKRLTLLSLDVRNEDEINSVYEQVSQDIDALDLLINNAGILYRGETPENITAQALLESFQVNAVAPVLMVKAFLPLLEQSSLPRVVNMTSQLGSISRKTYGGYYSYGASKAALNMLSRTLAVDLRSRGIVVVVFHPGWVRTDMGGEAAPVKPVDSVRGMMSIIERLTIEDSGNFYTWEGETLPW